jgi:F-type H+-transporting ATPase subunit gamma
VPNTRLIKRRIRSAQNISKITKAMEMVSASKMRRAQEQVMASRPFSERLAISLGEVAHFTDPSLHPLLQENPTGRPLLVVFSSDRGLCGGLNTNLFKIIAHFAQEHPDFQTLVVGRKAKEYVSRMGWDMVASFTNLPEKIRFQDVLPISDIIIPGFLGEEFSSVTIAHMKFISTLSQEPTFTPLLPLTSIESKHIVPEEKIFSKEYIFEPSPKDILDALLPAYIETQLYQMLLDARASEQSARMIAMQNASNNAQDVVGALQLEYNKSRQAGITIELIEMTAARLAMNG